MTEPRRAVLDTQIVLDLLHFADPRGAAVLAAILRGDLHCFRDRSCFAELERVVAYPRFALDASARLALLERYRSLSSACDAPHDEQEILPRCRDGDDQKFLQLANRCRADLLITRDRNLLRMTSDRRLSFVIVDGQRASRLLAIDDAYQGSP